MMGHSQQTTHSRMYQTPNCPSRRMRELKGEEPAVGPVDEAAAERLEVSVGLPSSSPDTRDSRGGAQRMHRGAMGSSHTSRNCTGWSRPTPSLFRHDAFGNFNSTQGASFGINLAFIFSFVTCSHFCLLTCSRMRAESFFCTRRTCARRLHCTRCARAPTPLPLAPVSPFYLIAIGTGSVCGLSQTKLCRVRS